MPRDSDTSRFTDVGCLTGDAEYGGSAAFSATVGTHVMDNVRLELEVGYGPVDIEGMTDRRVDGRLVDVPYGLTGESDVWTVTVTAAFDVPTQGPVRPDVGAGVGIAHDLSEPVDGSTPDALPERRRTQPRNTAHIIPERIYTSAGDGVLDRSELGCVQAPQPGQERPLVGPRLEVRVEEDAVAALPRAALQGKGDEVAESALR